MQQTSSLDKTKLSELSASNIKLEDIDLTLSKCDSFEICCFDLDLNCDQHRNESILFRQH